MCTGEVTHSGINEITKCLSDCAKVSAPRALVLNRLPGWERKGQRGKDNLVLGLWLRRHACLIEPDADTIHGGVKQRESGGALISDAVPYEMRISEELVPVVH